MHLDLLRNRCVRERTERSRQALVIRTANGARKALNEGTQLGGQSRVDATIAVRRALLTSLYSSAHHERPHHRAIPASPAAAHARDHLSGRRAAIGVTLWADPVGCAWGDGWVLSVYSCPNVESKHGHASAPSACPPRAAPRPVATGAQRPYATARPSAPPCACTLAAVASPPDAPPIVVVASPPSARAVAVSRG